MIRPHSIPPSLLVEGVYCSRRLWLKANHIEIFEEMELLKLSKTLKTEIEGLAWDDTGWIYEARLPSGSRLDAWVPEDSLGIEFKSGAPHTTHLYQAWALRQELSDLGVKDAEMQLWYLPRFAAEAEQLADRFGLDHGPLDDGIYAVCAESENPDFHLRLERSVSLLIDEAESDKAPPPHTQGFSACRLCAYNAHCYC